MAERRPIAIIDGIQREIPIGDTLPSDLLPDTTVFARWTPTLIATGSTFTIPENAQLLTVAPVQVDGLVIVDGTVVQADPEAACTVTSGGVGGGDCVIPDGCFYLSQAWHIIGTDHDADFNGGPADADAFAGALQAMSDNLDSSYLQADYDAVIAAGGEQLPWSAVFGLQFANFGRSTEIVQTLQFRVRCFISANSTAAPFKTYVAVQADRDNVNAPPFIPSGTQEFEVAEKGSIVDLVVGPFVNPRPDTDPWTASRFDNLKVYFQISDRLHGIDAPAADRPKIYGITMCATYAPAGDGPNVEYVVPSGPLLGYEGQVLGAPDTLTGAATAIADGTDTSYILNGTEVGANIAGFTALDNDSGLGIKSFYVVARVFSAHDGVVRVDLIDGIAPTPIQSNANYHTAVGAQDILVGPFSAGSSSWTPAQFHALSLEVTFDTGDDADKYLYSVSVRATLGA